MGKGAEGGGGGLNLTECLLGGQVRKMLGDFSSVLAILLGCGLDAFLGLATPKLMVPREFKVRAGRGGEREGEEESWPAGGILRARSHPSPLPPRFPVGASLQLVPSW